MTKKTTRIGIAGAGIVGSYLWYRMSHMDDVEVEMFEPQPKYKLGCHCAFGAQTEEIRRFARSAFFKVEDINKKLILKEVKGIDMNGVSIPSDNLCTIDKKFFVQSLLPSNNYHRNEIPDTKEFDVFIDATGAARAFLQPIKVDYRVPCWQKRGRVLGGLNPQKIYIKYGEAGYAWAFPLSGNQWHIGAGEMGNKDAKLLAGYGFPQVHSMKGCECRSSVRVVPPSYCEPFIQDNVVGVGESIGTVSPMVGEGIVPSLQCADIFMQTYNSYGKYWKRFKNIYANTVMSTFDWMNDEFDVVKNLMEGNRIRAAWGLYKMMSNGGRVGMDTSGVGFFDVMKMLRQQ